MVAAVTNLLGAIAWSPEIRNILAVGVGVVVLCGSTYLIVATNTGLRTGFLVALASLFGWMATMGVIWWIYGIGMLGDAPHWKPVELNYSSADFEGLTEANTDEVRRLANLAELPSAQEIIGDRPELVNAILPVAELTPEEEEARAANIIMGQVIEADPDLVGELAIEDALEGWHLLPQSDRQRGDAVATAQAFVGPEERGLFEASEDYLVLDAFSIGGKDPLPANPTRWDRIWNEVKSTIIQPLHPTHYTVVQLRAVEHVEVEPGQPAPTPAIDEDAPVVSVVMVRDLGDKRFPAFMITVIFGALFGVTCWSLHRRDAVIATRRAATV